LQGAQTYDERGPGVEVGYMGGFILPYFPHISDPLSPSLIMRPICQREAACDSARGAHRVERVLMEHRCEQPMG